MKRKKRDQKTDLAQTFHAVDELISESSNGRISYHLPCSAPRDLSSIKQKLDKILIIDVI